MMTGWPHISESFCPKVRPRMSVALPAVNGTTILTGLVGQLCALANVIHNRPSAAAVIRASFMMLSFGNRASSTAQSVVHRHIFRLQLHARGLGLQQQQLREILFRHAATD